MKKSVKKMFYLVVSIALLLLIISCRGNVPAGEKPIQTEAALQQLKTGTIGVQLELLPNYPPPLLYDQNQLVALVEVKNRGNYELDVQDCFVQVTGHDPNIITGIDNIRSCAEGIGGPLEGKTIYNLDGGINQLEFTSSMITLPEKVPDYQPNLNFLACYIYQTTATPTVCLDPLLYQVTSEQKTCRPQDVGLGGGQGGPVGVTYVGVDMTGQKAIFEINVRNFGTGRVLSPNTDIRNCGGISVDYRDLDKVEYTVQLTGGTGLVNCNPRDGVVRLTNGNGKIVCQVDIPNGPAFETPLMIDLDYAYIDSFIKPVKIIKTPQ